MEGNRGRSNPPLDEFSVTTILLSPFSFVVCEAQRFRRFEDRG